MSKLSHISAKLRRPRDLYITQDLAARARDPIDYKKEAEALQNLALRMADKPDEVLPLFVEIAMSLTGASSAGLSLYEPEPAPGIFRWRYLKGVLAPFENATTPRNHSSRGIAIDRDDVILTKHPERFYEWIADAGIVIPEAMLVPFYVDAGEPGGTLWIVAERFGQFSAEHARVLKQLAGFVGLSLRTQKHERRLRLALDEQEMLAMEMSHRLKNVFAMTEGMIRITARNAESTGAMAKILSGRLHALASAHSLVRGKASAIGSGAGVDLRGLISAVVKAHEDDELGAARFNLDGPYIDCGDHAINGIALLIHELATNAAKYGALTNAAGQVAISWRHEQGRVLLTWNESGGPPINSAPTRDGFGTTLAKRTVAAQFDGHISMEWRTAGLQIHMDLSAAKVAQ